MDEVQEKLRLLNSITRLLSPTLPSPPPSPPPTPSRLDGELPGRKHGDRRQDRSTRFVEADRDEPPTIGLGFENESGTNEGVGSKRARRSSPSPSTSSIRPPPPPPPLSKSSLDLKGLTPDLRDSPFQTPRFKKLPTFEALGNHEPKNSEDWKKEFPKERLRKMAASYRAKGRELKHTGDRISRETSATNPVGIAYQTDAILLYVFAFWCDDQAAKTCIPQNWQTIFGLVNFVKRAAEKAGLGLLQGICTRMEALAVYTLAMFEQKQLNHRGSQALASNSSSVSPSLLPLPPGLLPPPPPPSRGILPPPPPGLPARPNPPPPGPASSYTSAASPSSQSPHSTHSPPAITTTAASNNPQQPLTSTSFEVLKSFVKSGPDLFRYQKLWDESAHHFTPLSLAIHYPRTYESCISSNVTIDPSSFVSPCPRIEEEGEEKERDGEWEFAWPVELGRPMCVVHTIAFLRCVLSEWAQTNAKPYKVEVVEDL